MFAAFVPNAGDVRSHPGGSKLNNNKKKVPQIQYLPNPQWLGVLKHSYGELFRLVFCGCISVLLLAALAQLRLHPFVELQTEVTKHLINLPLGLVFLAMLATALPILLVNVLASVVRALAAQQLALLAFHMTCLWFGAQIASLALAIDFSAGAFEASLDQALSSLAANFTIVATAHATAVISDGALDEHNSTFARLLQAVCALATIWFLFQLLSSPHALGTNGLALPNDLKFKLIGLLCFILWFAFGLISLQKITEREEISRMVQLPLETTLLQLQQPEFIAKTLYRSSSQRIIVVPFGSEVEKDTFALSAGSKRKGTLRLVEFQNRKIFWECVLANGMIVRFVFTVSKGDKHATSKIVFEKIVTYDTKILKRFTQNLTAPRGLFAFSENAAEFVVNVASLNT